MMAIVPDGRPPENRADEEPFSATISHVTGLNELSYCDGGNSMKHALHGLILVCLVAGGVRAQIPAFQHIVVIVQENRTPDNLFQGLCSAPYGSSSSCSKNPGDGQYNIQTTDWKDKNSLTGTTQP